MLSETMHKDGMKNRGVLLLISAPSGGGKTTVCTSMLAQNPGIRRVITCTTRPPRPGEVDGVDYHFFSMEEFERRINAGEFLENARVYANRYGTLRASVLDVLRAGWDVLLNIDVQGAASIRAAAQTDAELGSALVTVFLTPATLVELEARLRGRGSEAEDVVERRLAAAPGEVSEARHFDYLVISGTREEDLKRVQSIYVAEQARRHRVAFEFGGVA
jgi:guanylate kinase